jgi:hypothetical protein
VHVSPCGKHLAILVSDNRLLLIERFHRLISRESKLNDIGTNVVFGSIVLDSSCYLAFHDDKVGVATVNQCSLRPEMADTNNKKMQHAGIFVITLDSAHRGIEGPWKGRGSLEGTGRSFPNLALTSVRGFDTAPLLREISCLQLTRTGIFFPWKYTRTSHPQPRSPISPSRSLS